MLAIGAQIGSLGRSNDRDALNFRTTSYYVVYTALYELRYPNYYGVFPSDTVFIRDNTNCGSMTED